MRERVGDQRQGSTNLSECYSLPIDALLVIMSDIDHVTLHAQATTLPGMARDTYQVALTLHYGEVTCCQVFIVNGGIVLDGEHAIHALQTIGDIKWYLSLSPMPGQKSEKLRHAAVVSSWSDLVPRRVPATISLQQLPQRVRHVLSLVDGNRSLPQIAHLLHLSIEEVFQILCQASETGWINELYTKEE